MWYVNMFIQQKLNEKITSYVLTMWDVNYRGILFEVPCILGYVLTMWDVNW